MLNKLQQVVEKAKFMEISQHLTSGAQNGLDQTSSYHFQQECVKSLDLMLPIMGKIKAGGFVLQDYALTEGQVKGISKAIALVRKPKIRVLFFDNNKMSDTMTATLFNALAE